MFGAGRPCASFSLESGPLESREASPMGTFTDFVASVVVHSSAVAYSHFGVTLEPVRAEPSPAVERTVARTPRQALKVSDCPPAPVQLRSKNQKA